MHYQLIACDCMTSCSIQNCLKPIRQLISVLSHQILDTGFTFLGLFLPAGRAHCIQLVLLYSYFVISCLSVCLCPSMVGLGRPGNKLMVAAGTCGCFELAGLSPPRCKKKPNDGSTIDSRGTALVKQEQYRESSARSTGMARNQQATINKPRSEIALVLQYSGSHKRAPQSSRLAEPARMHQSTSR